MKTIFRSELLNKDFESADACHRAELQYRIDQEQLKRAKKEECACKCDMKQKLLNEVNDAKEKYIKAEETYEKAATDVRNLIKECNDECIKILTPVTELKMHAKDVYRKALRAYKNETGSLPEDVACNSDDVMDFFKSIFDFLN